MLDSKDKCNRPSTTSGRDPRPLFGLSATNAQKVVSLVADQSQIQMLLANSEFWRVPESYVPASSERLQCVEHMQSTMPTIFGKKSLR